MYIRKQEKDALGYLSWNDVPLLECNDPRLNVFEPPALSRRSDKIARLRRQMRMQVPGSRRWSRLIIEIGRQMNDLEENRRRSHQKVAKKICSRYHAVLIEDPVLRAKCCRQGRIGCFNPSEFIKVLRAEGERRGTAVILTELIDVKSRDI